MRENRPKRARSIGAGTRARTRTSSRPVYIFTDTCWAWSWRRQGCHVPANGLAQWRVRSCQRNKILRERERGKKSNFNQDHTGTLASSPVSLSDCLSDLLAGWLAGKFGGVEWGRIGAVA